MTRFDTAFLELTDATGTAVFELSIGLQNQGEIEKNFLMGPRGQYITEVYNQLNLLGDVDSVSANRRAAFQIDGGAGEWQKTLSFETGLEDVQWGDGSGGDGPDNVTVRDAGGANVKAQARQSVLELWVARAKTDSNNPAFLYTNEWATGKHHPEAGAFNQPFVCSVTNLTTEPPDPNDGDQVSLSGTITVRAITLFDDLTPPGVLGDSNIGTYTEKAADALEDFSDE